MSDEATDTTRRAELLIRRDELFMDGRRLLVEQDETIAALRAENTMLKRLMQSIIGLAAAGVDGP